MLIVVGIFGFRSLAGLGYQRFPHAADVATISTIYYSVPLSMAGFFSVNYRDVVFLSSAAADGGLAFKSMTFVVIALISLQVGRSAGSVIELDRTSYFSALNAQSTTRTGMSLILLVSITAFGIWLFGISEFLAGYATESEVGTASIGNALVYSAVECIGLAVAFALLIGRVKGKIPFKFLLLVALMVLIFVLLVRAKRLEVVSAFIPTAILLLSRRSSISTTAWRLIGTSIAVALLVVISALRASDTLDPFRTLYYFFSEGLYAGHSLPGIIDRIDLGMIGYEHGLRFLNALLGFIPRFVWPGKDDMVYAGNQVLEGVAPLGATNLLAEIVLQGGLIAVAISYVGMGYLFERLSRFDVVWDDALAQRYLPLRFGFYLIAVAIFIPHFRDGIIPAVKLSLQAAVFIVLLFGAKRMVTQIASRRNNDAERNPHHLAAGGTPSGKA
jgi:hypothetical protein